MSSFIVTSISIKKNKVFLTGYSSNVYPKIPQRFESSYLSDMLKTGGKEAVDLYLLEQYAGGMMRGGNNDYTNTIRLYGNATYENLLKLRAEKKKSSGKKYVIQSSDGMFFTRITRKGAFSSPFKEQAKHFSYIQAKAKAKSFSGVNVVEA
jgi:hypothetical protein